MKAKVFSKLIFARLVFVKMLIAIVETSDGRDQSVLRTECVSFRVVSKSLPYFPPTAVSSID